MTGLQKDLDIREYGNVGLVGECDPRLLFSEALKWHGNTIITRRFLLGYMLRIWPIVLWKFLDLHRINNSPCSFAFRHLYNHKYRWSKGLCKEWHMALRLESSYVAGVKWRAKALKRQTTENVHIKRNVALTID